MRKIAALLIVVLGAACSSGSGSVADGPTAANTQLAAEVASYELLAGTTNRFLVGLFENNGETVSYGTVKMEFSYLGTESKPISPEPKSTETGSFILVPNDDSRQPPATDEALHAAASLPPALTQPDQVRGVYQVPEVKFDETGFWQVDVTARLDGIDRTVSANFEVVDTPSYPAIGQAAPSVDNYLYKQKGAKPSWVDSRATDGWASVADANLHAMTVADALESGRPTVVVVSTPLYCVSRFCGPVTDEIAMLQARFTDESSSPTANFIHIEIWKDYQNKVINKAAARWVYSDGDVTEPWVFLITPTGKIVDRWQNVLDRPQLSAELAALLVKEGASP